MDSDNPTGADNQQETSSVLEGSSETVREASSHVIPACEDEETVRPLWRHREPGRNVLASSARFVDVIDVIALRVTKCLR
jgi:hypothetical protein